MRDHESALQQALIAHLRADSAIRALLGEPARVWDQAPRDVDWPWLAVGRSESRPVAADGCGVEHTLSLRCASLFSGTEEARAVLAAVRAALHEATLEADGVRTVSIRAIYADVFRSNDQKRIWGVVRVRAVTEEI
ncbi:DUF3168 domain-containing protein [Brevundimonas subvibrioides]|uniref:DUF3168 domain-containing protein n=1 Tax=Brevundimonas subvibrioides (strain ATCC 15264 / DSM 4735 / LMG 14903 / NBRC 16000 / CB 81) TaxID=633149 RepID=D9QF88_BRESC|nr:DUF3168 domain-containing protein [Brevundimonas subvibrioides]ADL00573.1 conserved hypothetical protein [Brevundimonas subvibrioides ATCC 15264]